MGESISHFVIKLNQKDTKIQILEDKIGRPHSKNVETMNRLDLNKISSKDKCDKIMNRLNKTPNIHKYIKN